MSGNGPGHGNSNRENTPNAESKNLRDASFDGHQIDQETAIPTEEIQHRLRNLEDYMETPGGPGPIEFAGRLASRLGDSITPEGFQLAAEVLIHDMQTKTDSLTGEPISGVLDDAIPGAFKVLRSMTPEIAQATCPPEFAQKVKELMQA